MEQSPLAAILGHLTQMSDRQTQLQRTQNEVLLELGQSLTADRAVLQELLVSSNREREPRAAGAVGHIHIPKMGETDDAEAFLETFRGVAEVSGWPRQEWAHRLLPLLTGEAQLAAHSLPAGAQRDYEAVDKAIRDRLGLNPEEHRRRFRALTFAEGDRPFTYAQQLRDQARRWLAPERNNPEEIVEQVALERFVEGLPARTSTWVRYHRPESLSAAVNIAEGHLIPPSTDRRPPAPTPSPRTGAAALRGYRPTPLPRARWGGGPTPEQAHEPPSPLLQTGHQTAREGCWRCGRPGHHRRDCPMMEVGQVVRVTGAPIPPYGPGEAYRIPVRIQRGTYQALLDSGCMQTMIHQRLVRSEALVEASSVAVRCIHGDVHTYPLVPIEIRYGGKTHSVKAAVSPSLTYPLILGIDWAGFPGAVSESAGVRTRQIGTCKSCAVFCADARVSDAAQGSGEEAGGSQPEGRASTFPPVDDFPLEQSRDATLRYASDQVIAIDGLRVQPDAALTYPHFVVIRDRLYRVSRDTQSEEVVTQLLVPRSRREMIFQAAHYNPMAGHLGYDKTLNRIMARFYWPGIRAEVRRWCASCPECQLVNPPAIPRAPLRPLPLVEVPFDRVGMDIIGPLERSAQGYRFVLVLIDYATRYPEAIPLRNISARSVAQALFHVISRVGIPKEILTDQGTNFMSRTIKELYGLLKVKAIRTSVYHPATDGLCERFNRTLKSMIRKFVLEDARNWHQWLDPLLFAVREVPQASTGFSPFELLYGRRPRGVLDLIKENWEEGSSDSKNEIQYVMDLRAKLHSLGVMSREHLRQAQENQKRLYDRGTRLRDFTPGDKVLVLLPTSSTKLLAKWQGPFVVTRRVGDVDYEVVRSDRGDARQIYHINLLKRWNDVVPVAFATTLPEGEELGPEVPAPGPVPPVGRGEDLSESQAADVVSLQLQFADVFSPLPGRTPLITHDIETQPGLTVRTRPYRLPVHKQDVVRRELAAMLDLGVVEESHSDWCSPVVLVGKPDGAVRFCVDYRRVNAVSKFDAYPMPRIDELVDRLGMATYYTTLDCTKGYWQIPLSPAAREKTAFSTPLGLYQFKVLPFGLFGAPATFQRLMDRVLRPHAAYAAAYLDDIVIYGDDWGQHMQRVAAVLQSLRQAGLTANPKKCVIGRREIQYLGFHLGRGKVRPQVGKTAAVAAAPRPRTKKEVRRFLGLAGYYRQFVPNFSDLASPLTDLTRKRAPDTVQWSEPCQVSFDAIKSALCGEAVLCAPNFALPFSVQADASDRGLGAVLTQQVGGADRPVLYLSRKLSDREGRYSTIEKECLAIRWAVGALRYYLLGRQFTLYSDHAPLQWLHRMKDANARITRWYLALQPFHFQVAHRPGSQMVVADFLSRSGGGE